MQGVPRHELRPGHGGWVVGASMVRGGGHACASSTRRHAPRGTSVREMTPSGRRGSLVVESQLNKALVVFTFRNCIPKVEALILGLTRVHLAQVEGTQDPLHSRISRQRYNLK